MNGVSIWSLDTGMNIKEKAAYDYTPWKSAHPTSCKRAIISGEAFRRRTLCSGIQQYKEAIRHMTTCFLKQGYPIQEIIKTTAKYQYEERDKVLKRLQDSLAYKEEKLHFRWKNKPIKKANKETSKKVIIPLVVRYNPSHHNIWKRLRFLLAPSIIKGLGRKIGGKCKTVIAYRGNTKLL
eukprot:GHVQ01039288.1.p1 GENE.GHVQ01039288.1~~GHVQ01039288.1.p1  ORF type:complete len:180 (-),score=13.35 GHVQ01039288.1:536-1075(-)